MLLIEGPVIAGPMPDQFGARFMRDARKRRPIHRRGSVGGKDFWLRLSPIVRRMLWLVFLRKSQEWLEHHVRKHPNQPFFLYHAASAVHLPSFAAEQFKGATKAGPHGDFIFELDYIVGQLMETLERLGVADNTLVIFTSDNGPEVTTVLHMRADYGHDGARPWRGLKRDNWEGGHRVPFIVRWPGHVKPGTVCDLPICHTDIMA
ncbi:MAG: sulfatase-like hydrolase/transferase, partial [Clostridia bacterium]|nr:sulfatase-like hydrolase/transferase [Clostridia bacterium]